MQKSNVTQVPMWYIFKDMPATGKFSIFVKVLTVSALLIFCASGVFGQDGRIPAAATNWLQVADVSGNGDRDQTMVVFFQVPDTYTGNIYFGIRDPEANNTRPDVEGNALDLTTYTLRGGPNALSASDSRSPDFSSGEDPHLGTFIQSYVYDNDNTAVSGPNISGDDEWVYFTGVDKLQGEKIGSNYYFKIVIEATDGGAGGMKNAYQLIATDDPTQTPAAAANVHSFA